MIFLSRRHAYIEANFQLYSNKQLADRLNISEKDVQVILSDLGIRRRKKDKDRLSESPPPPYTAEAGRPSGLTSLVKADFWVSAFAALCALAIYVITLAPTVSGEDSGELITAAYTLGVAHPPGYPLWCLLGKLFTLVPIGTVAARVNFMSAFFAALAVFVVSLIIIKTTKNRLAGFAGALFLAFSSEFWEQSIIAEVYGLNSFLVVLAVFLLLLWYQHRRPKPLMAFALVFGLGLCNHNTMMLLGPVFLGFVLFIDPKFWFRWKLYLTCTIIAVSCLAIYAYLPIRSAVNPPVDWGNPETWDGFRDHVTRAQYSFATKENPHTASRLLGQLWAFVKLYAWEFGPWLCWMPLLGVVALWKREKTILAFLFTIGLVTSLGIIWATNFDIDRQSLWLNNVFWIPAYIMAAIGAGIGLDWIEGQQWPRIPAKRVVWGLALAMVASPFLLNFAHNSKRYYFYAHDFGKNTLLSMDENAIYFPTADHATFPVLYYQAVEGMRPDIALANIYGYPEESLYADMPEDIRQGFGPIPNAGQEHFIEKWIIEHTDRPVYFTRKRDMRDLPDYEIVEHGLIFAVRKKDDPTELTPPWDNYRWYSLDPDETQGELTADSILADGHYMRGRSWLQEGDQKKALLAFDIAAKLGPESKETMNNLGSACAEYGLTEKAMEYYKQCIELAPDYAMARKNLGQIYLGQGDVNNALLQFEAYLEESPDDPQVLKSSADCMARIGWYQDAITRLEYLLRLTPGDASLYKSIGQYYEEGKISIRQANAYYAKSLEIDPTQQDLLAKLNPAAPEPEIPGMPDGMPGAGLPEIPGLNLPTAPGLPQIPTPGNFGGAPQLPTP